jgi:hypothetical protein
MALIDGSCQACHEGTFATKWINITSWENLDDFFDTSCVTASGADCGEGSGWFDDGEYLVTRT